MPYKSTFPFRFAGSTTAADRHLNESKPVLPSLVRTILLVFVVGWGTAIGVTRSVAGDLRLAAPVPEGIQLRLHWTDGTPPYQVEEALAPGGPWQAFGGATSELTALVPIAADRRFFRVAGGGDAGISREEAAMRSTLSAVGTFVDGVPREDIARWRSDILSFLNGRADIDSAGESADGVWAITMDGIPLAIWNNRPADPPADEPSLSRIVRAGTEIPGTQAARFAVTVGAGFRQAAPALSRLLGGAGYSPGFDGASLESLKGVRNESVFFFNTHGGVFFIPQFGDDGKPNRGADGRILYETHYGLWTGTKIDPFATDISYRHNEFVADLKAKRLALALAPASYVTGTGGFQSPVSEWHFGITAEWIKRYLSFPPQNHASVWLGACQSGSDSAAPLRAALRSVGAEMVSGWTGNVHGDAVLNATSFLYDRLLGANKVVPPATPQRPFDYENSWKELRSRGLHRYPTHDDKGVPTTTDIIYEGVPGDATFGLFAPSIAYVLIGEVDQQAHLFGLFGNPPADQRKVTIGGAEATVISWDSRAIVCSLAATGSGSAGDVQVVVQGRKSNLRQITRWTLTGTYQMKGEEPPHQIDGALTLVFRADIGEYRKEPGNVFIRPTRYATAAKHSEIHLEAKGILSTPCDPGTERIIWSGSGSFPASENEAPAMTVAYLSVDSILQVGALGVVYGMRDMDQFPLKMRYEPCDGGAVEFPLAPAPPGPVEVDPLMFGSPLDERLPDGTRLEFPLPGQSFSMDTDWGISAGNMQSELESSMKWNRTPAEFPPSPDAAR